jgi:hypothetical protein
MKNQIKRLFLDDLRIPTDCPKTHYMTYRGVDLTIYHEEWNIVRSHGQFVNWIEQNGLPDLISFDNDLGDDTNLKGVLPIEEWFDIDNNREYTGYDSAHWLVNYCLDNNLILPEFAVHSANPAGYENIQGLLTSFKKQQLK